MMFVIGMSRRIDRSGAAAPFGMEPRVPIWEGVEHAATNAAEQQRTGRAMLDRLIMETPGNDAEPRNIPCMGARSSADAASNSGIGRQIFAKRGADAPILFGAGNP